jgi:hypothetical protein
VLLPAPAAQPRSCAEGAERRVCCAAGAEEHTQWNNVLCIHQFSQVLFCKHNINTVFPQFKSTCQFDLQIVFDPFSTHKIDIF